MPDELLAAQAALPLQKQLDATGTGGTLELLPGEYAGPLVITRPVAIHGRGATIWAQDGPVLRVSSVGVVLRDLRVEITGDSSPSQAPCAILVDPGAELGTAGGVEVRGMVVGVPAEDGVWRYPHVLALGQIGAGQDHHFRMRVIVPVLCSVESHISGLELTPTRLLPGPHELHLEIERLGPDTLLYGYILLRTERLTRRICMTGLAKPLATTEHEGTILWQPPDWAQLTARPRHTRPPATGPAISVTIPIEPDEAPGPSYSVSLPLPPKPPELAPGPVAPSSYRMVGTKPAIRPLRLSPSLTPTPTPEPHDPDEDEWRAILRRHDIRE